MAQLVAHMTLNHVVLGSNPSPAAIYFERPLYNIAVFFLFITQRFTEETLRYTEELL